MVGVEDERTWGSFSFQGLLLLGSFLLLILHIFVLVWVVPLLSRWLFLMVSMKRKHAGTKVSKRHRNAKGRLVDRKEASSAAAVVVERDSKDEPTINSALPPEMMAHVLQKLRTGQACQAASRVCNQWFLTLAEIELRRRRQLGRCMYPRKKLQHVSKCKYTVCDVRKMVHTVDQPSGVGVAACLLRLCKLHTKGLVIKDARRMNPVDCRLVGQFGDNLSHLTIQNCHSLDNKRLLEVLPGCTSLRSLHLTVTPLLDDEAAMGIAKMCPRLEQLHLAGCYRLRSAGVVALLQGCPNLVKLQLKAMGHGLDAPSQELFPVIPDGPSWKLRILGMTSSDLVTDELLALMAPRLHNLQQLDVSNCPLVSDTGIAILIQECQGTLKDLKVKGSAVSDATLKELAGSATKVRLLSVAKCENVTDCGIHALATAEKIRSLRHLCISGSGVSDKGLEHLAKKQATMSGLKILDVQGCPDISGTGAMSALGNQMVIIS